MQGERRPLYGQRLARDLTELYSHNFFCSSSTVAIVENGHPPCSYCGYCRNNDFVKTVGLQIAIHEGPYRGGSYNFLLHIPDSYPFKPVEVIADQPIWHPNIDLRTGRVFLPIDWCPVLTLNSLALAVQMVMLEPSAENPTNLEAYRYFMTDSRAFESAVQKTLDGNCTISGFPFSYVRCEGPQVHEVNGRNSRSSSAQLTEVQSLPEEPSDAAESSSSCMDVVTSINIGSEEERCPSTTDSGALNLPSSAVSSASNYATTAFSRPNQGRKRSPPVSLTVIPFSAMLSGAPNSGGNAAKRKRVAHLTRACSQLSLET